MKNHVTIVGLLALGASATALHAGDIERSTQSVGILFEEGRYVEFSYGYAKPDVSGAVSGLQSGDMAGDFSTYALGYKQALGANMDLALIIDQPIGADVDYGADEVYPLAGTTAELNANAITALLRYKMPNNVSVYGGLRAQSVEGQVNILFNTFTEAGSIDYDLDTNKDYAFGYVVGVAWEKPEIAARVSLTYNSAIEHTLTGTESGTFLGATQTFEEDFDTTIPQSVSLEFQSGIAADTLLFGSVRWVEWSEFVINPTLYQAYFPDVPLVAYDSNRITYTLGLGRKFTEAWSGAITASYEPSTGDLTGNLGPNDGYKSIGIGATYTHEAMKITGGVRYVELGGATTRGVGADFDDNSAVGLGLRVAYSF